MNEKQFCVYCGAELSPDTKFCTNCGHEADSSESVIKDAEPQEPLKCVEGDESKGMNEPIGNKPAGEFDSKNIDEAIPWVANEVGLDSHLNDKFISPPKKRSKKNFIIILSSLAGVVLAIVVSLAVYHKYLPKSVKKTSTNTQNSKNLLPKKHHLKAEAKMPSRIKLALAVGSKTKKPVSPPVPPYRTPVIQYTHIKPTVRASSIPNPTELFRSNFEDASPSVSLVSALSNKHITYAEISSVRVSASNTSLNSTETLNVYFNTVLPGNGGSHSLKVVSKIVGNGYVYKNVSNVNISESGNYRASYNVKVPYNMIRGRYYFVATVESSAFLEESSFGYFNIN